MSYARFSYADVYVFMSVYGHLECCGCSLEANWRYDSTQEMVDHIRKHREAGHDVPADLEELLWTDDKDNFPPQCAEGHDWGEPYRPYADHGDDWVSQNIWRRKCSRCEWEDHSHDVPTEGESDATTDSEG